MSRKLKRKLKKKYTSTKKKSPNPVEEAFEKAIKKTKKIKRYKKKRCAFVKNGIQCRNNSVGKSTLCKKHGGNPIIEKNLITDTEVTELLVNTKYNPQYHPIQFIDLSRSGLSEIEIAAEFGIGLNTLRGWSEKFSTFHTAYEIGQALHEAWYLQQGKSGLRDRNFNTSLFKFLTGNKLGYSEKIENKNLNMNVHGVLMVPDKQTEDEWEEATIIEDKNASS